MKVKTLEIIWHNKDPVLSVDISSQGKIASAGADREIKLWRLVNHELGQFSVEFLAHLQRHTNSVNAVRFSPTSPEVLASASDDGCIIIWKYAGNTVVPTFGDDSAGENKEQWNCVTILRSGRDIYDISWSPDGLYLLSGSIDNRALLWEVAKGRFIQQFEDHAHYVQGVAWDPLGKFLITQSSDRTCRVYSANARSNIKSFTCAKVLASRRLDGITKPEGSVGSDTTKDKENHDSSNVAGVGGEPSTAAPQTHRLFQDETVPTFFRRPAWSPDGQVFVTPTGLWRTSGERSPMQSTSYVWARRLLKAPVAHLPCDSPSVCVRFCPCAFQLRNGEQTDAFGAPYRHVFAVATLDKVFIYDTQHVAPLAVVSKIHYAPLTDLAWSHDGQVLFVASMDGYCTIVAWEDEELGIATPRP